MPQVYPDTGDNLQPYRLTDENLLAIGRLIRACAEMEDLLNLYLCRLAEVSEGKSVILMGKTPVSQRLKIAAIFAQARAGKAEEDFKQCFGQQGFTDTMRCRNTVAHGVLLGITDKGLIAFRVPESTETTPDTVSLQVNAYAAEDLAGYALNAEAVIPEMEARLGLQGRHETRRALALTPHRKSQSRTKQRNAQPVHPPQS